MHRTKKIRSYQRSKGLEGSGKNQRIHYQRKRNGKSYERFIQYRYFPSGGHFFTTKYLENLKEDIREHPEKYGIYFENKKGKLWDMSVFQKSELEQHYINTLTHFNKLVKALAPKEDQEEIIDYLITKNKSKYPSSMQLYAWHETLDSQNYSSKLDIRYRGYSITLEPVNDSPEELIFDTCSTIPDLLTFMASDDIVSIIKLLGTYHPYAYYLAISYFELIEYHGYNLFSETYEFQASEETIDLYVEEFLDEDDNRISNEDLKKNFRKYKELDKHIGTFLKKVNNIAEKIKIKRKDFINMYKPGIVSEKMLFNELHLRERFHNEFENVMEYIHCEEENQEFSVSWMLQVSNFYSYEIYDYVRDELFSMENYDPVMKFHTENTDNEIKRIESIMCPLEKMNIMMKDFTEKNYKFRIKSKNQNPYKSNEFTYYWYQYQEGMQLELIKLRKERDKWIKRKQPKQSLDTYWQFTMELKEILPDMLKLLK